MNEQNKRCYVCGGDHLMVKTPFPEHGDLCPYDVSGTYRITDKTNRLDGQRVIAMQHVMIALKRVVGVLNETIDNYDRVMTDREVAGESVQDQTMRRFDEWRQEE